MSDKATLDRWIVRQPRGTLLLAEEVPQKTSRCWTCPGGQYAFLPIHAVGGWLPENVFPSVTWEDDEPTEVEVTIKIKEK